LPWRYSSSRRNRLNPQLCIDGYARSPGHSSIGIASTIYVHLVGQTNRDAGDAFEAYVSSAMRLLEKTSADRYLIDSEFLNAKRSQT